MKIKNERLNNVVNELTDTTVRNNVQSNVYFLRKLIQKKLNWEELLEENATQANSIPKLLENIEKSNHLLVEENSILLEAVKRLTAIMNDTEVSEDD